MLKSSFICSHNFFDSNLMNIIWFDHVLFALVGIILPVMSIMAERPSALDDSDAGSSYDMIDLPPKKHIYYTNGLTLFIGALIVITLWNATYRSFDVLGICSPLIDKTVVIIAALLLGIYLSDTLINYLNANKAKESIKELSNIMPTSWGDYQHFIFLAIAAGVCEEVVFRGFLVNYINQIFSGSAYVYMLSIIIPALVFSLSHMYQGWFAVVKIFAISLLFGALFIYSKSLLLVSIIHVLVDLISGAVMVKVFQKSGLK